VNVEKSTLVNRHLTLMVDSCVLIMVSPAKFAFRNFDRWRRRRSWFRSSQDLRANRELRAAVGAFQDVPSAIQWSHQRITDGPRLLQGAHCTLHIVFY